MRVVDGVDLQALDEPVLEIVREVETLGPGDGAVGLGQRGVALGEDARRVAVIGDAVSFEQPALVIDLNGPARRDGVLFLVVDELLGLDDHARIGARGRRRGSGGVRGEGRLGESERARKNG